MLLLILTAVDDYGRVFGLGTGTRLALQVPLLAAMVRNVPLVVVKCRRVRHLLYLWIHGAVQSLYLRLAIEARLSGHGDA